MLGAILSLPMFGPPYAELSFHLCCRFWAESAYQLLFCEKVSREGFQAQGLSDSGFSGIWEFVIFSALGLRIRFFDPYTNPRIPC